MRCVPVSHDFLSGQNTTTHRPPVHALWTAQIKNLQFIRVHLPGLYRKMQENLT
jgi:hypothetical protein